MTLVAAFHIENCPVVLGDLLITNETAESVKVGLPAIGVVSDLFAKYGISVLGLRQKVTLISDRCVLAWAGDMEAAGSALGELRKIAQTQKLTRENVSTFLARHPDVLKYRTAFVGWVHEETENRFGHIHHDAKLTDAGDLGSMAFQGTGSDAVKELVKHWGHMRLQAHGHTSVAAQAISTALSMVGILIRSEFKGGYTANSLLNCFGGGYEVAAYFNHRFRKVEDLTLLIWSATVSSHGVNLSYPQLIIKQTYIKDTLLIRSAKILHEEGSPLRLIEEQHHAISPVYANEAEVTERDLENLSFNSPLICHCIVTDYEDGKPTVLYTRVDTTGSGSTPLLVIRDNPGGISFELNKEFLSNVARGLHESFLNAGPNPFRQTA